MLERTVDYFQQVKRAHGSCFEKFMHLKKHSKLTIFTFWIRQKTILSQVPLALPRAFHAQEYISHVII